MALTRDFRETVRARAKADPAFRAGLYQEAVQCMLDGDLATARILLRDFVNATVGFAVLAGRMGVHEKSLMRMLGKSGNPKAANLLAALRALRAECGLTVTVNATVSVSARAARPRVSQGGRPRRELRAT
jgi:DNA-binding phage protein